MNPKLQALKNKAIDITSDVLSAPARAYYGAKSAISNEQFKQRRAARNFRNRKDNTNYYKGTDYWSQNTN